MRFINKPHRFFLTSILGMGASAIIITPVHAAVLYSQTDFSGTPYQLPGENFLNGYTPGYTQRPWSSFLQTLPLTSGTPLFVKFKGSLSAASTDNAEVNTVNLGVSSTSSSGGYYGGTGIGWSSPRCLPATNGGVALADYDCQLTIAAGISSPQTMFIGMQNMGRDWGGDPQFTIATGATGLPYFILSNTPSHAFYSQLGYGTDGGQKLYSLPSTSSEAIKRLPDGWIVQVSSTTDSEGMPILAEGYQWYSVTDPTDNITGWMPGADASNTIEYLPYASTQQISFEATSSSELGSVSERSAKISEAFDHYYNDTNTFNSLYSSNDGINNISSLKTGGYPKELLLGIAAQESGGVNFNNEYVTHDYGHGIMQITPYKLLFHEPLSSGNWQYNAGDNRGIASGIRIYPCTSNASDAYAKCYTHGGEGDSVDSKSYGSLYKYYTNTSQSIYANIKDGMKILTNKFNRPYVRDITTNATVGTTTYSAADRQAILATEAYNGSNCGYVSAVANRLRNIQNYFQDATTSEITGLVEKMRIAGSHAVCAQLRSPGNLSIQDNSGITEGVEQGTEKNEFPLAVYDADEKSVKILEANDESYTYRVEGTAQGTYGLDITTKQGDQEYAFQATDIPTTVGEVHTYTVNTQALIEGQSNAVTMRIQNADGSSAIVATASSTLAGAQLSQTSPVQPPPPTQASSTETPEALSTEPAVAHATNTNLGMAHSRGTMRFLQPFASLTSSSTALSIPAPVTLIIKTIITVGSLVTSTITTAISGVLNQPAPDAPLL